MFPVRPVSHGAVRELHPQFAVYAPSYGIRVLPEIVGDGLVAMIITGHLTQHGDGVKSGDCGVAVNVL